MIFMAKQLAEVQGFVPAHFYKQPNKILAAMLYGRDLGITPTNALQHIIVIDGKATADAQLMGMLVRRAGHRLEDVTTDTDSTVTITRGDDGSVHRFSFSIADAQRAGLVRQGSAWQKFPQAMLFARALSGCARKAAQDALMGTAYTPEELDGGNEPIGEIKIIDAAPETRAALEAAQSVEVASASSAGPLDASATSNAPELPSPPPQTAATRKGRSVGPAARRTNVVTVEPQTPTMAPDPAPAPTAQPEPVPSQPAPAGLTDEPDILTLPDDGQAVYLLTLRTDLLARAAVLYYLQVRYKNEFKNPARPDLWEQVPDLEPNPGSEAALANLIGREDMFPGRSLDQLNEDELKHVSETVEPFIEKRKAQFAEKGIAV